VARHVEGYGLAEAAELCKCSLATYKRRLARAEKRFEALSRGDPVLKEMFCAPGREP
jgi:DNA-directed RNA polymerase specialized sigma24 family protein